MKTSKQMIITSWESEKLRMKEKIIRVRYTYEKHLHGHNKH